MSIVGSRESDGWEMKVLGPIGFERSYTLVGSAGKHQALVIGNVLLRLLPAKILKYLKGRSLPWIIELLGGERSRIS